MQWGHLPLHEVPTAVPDKVRTAVPHKVQIAMVHKVLTAVPHNVSCTVAETVQILQSKHITSAVALLALKGQVLMD